MSDLHDAGRDVASVATRIDEWLAGFAASNPAIAAVDRGDG